MLPQQVIYRVYHNHIAGTVVSREVNGKGKVVDCPLGLFDALHGSSRSMQVAVEDWFEGIGWVVTHYLTHQMDQGEYAHLNTELQRALRTANTRVITIVVAPVFRTILICKTRQMGHEAAIRLFGDNEFLKCLDYLDPACPVYISDWTINLEWFQKGWNLIKGV